METGAIIGVIVSGALSVAAIIISILGYRHSKHRGKVV